MFWRAGLDKDWCDCFRSLLWVGEPVEYYTVKKFKTWDDFWSWDGCLEEKRKIVTRAKVLTGTGGSNGIR